MADRIRQPPVVGPRRNVPAPGNTSSRSLFQSRLTRRPTPIAGSGPSSGAPNAMDSSVEAMRLAAENESNDIVVRDRNGEIEIGELPMAGMLDEADEGVMHDQEESKQERQRLADAVKQHRVNHAAVPDQPEELLEAVRRSLKAKVAALDEDQWMFAPGDHGLRR